MSIFHQNDSLFPANPQQGSSHLLEGLYLATQREATMDAPEQVQERLCYRLLEEQVGELSVVPEAARQAALDFMATTLLGLPQEEIYPPLAYPLNEYVALENAEVLTAQGLRMDWVAGRLVVLVEISRSGEVSIYGKNALGQVFSGVPQEHEQKLGETLLGISRMLRESSPSWMGDYHQLSERGWFSVKSFRETRVKHLTSLLTLLPKNWCLMVLAQESKNLGYLSVATLMGLWSLLGETTDDTSLPPTITRGATTDSLEAAWQVGTTLVRVEVAQEGMLVRLWKEDGGEVQEVGGYLPVRVFLAKWLRAATRQVERRNPLWRTQYINARFQEEHEDTPTIVI